MEAYCLRNGGRLQRPRRVIGKSGERNINFTNLPQRSKRYIQDFVTTIVSELNTMLQQLLWNCSFRLKRVGESLYLHI